jgi:phage terminase large subunit-like protein
VVGQLAAKAMQLPSAQNNFRTKHLDIWVSADSSWMDLRAWKKCADTNLSADDFAGEQCWGGLDLASKVDLAVAVKLFRRVIGGDKHYYAFLCSWLPESAVQDSSNSQYAGWVESGLIRVTPGNVIDFDEIEAELDSWPSKFEVVSVAFDPFQATQFSTHMTGKGFPMVEVRAIVLNFSEPMKELDALVRSGRFHHDGNPMFEWMISNVVCHADKKDNIYPNKQRAENKIDGVVATLMALGRAMVAPDAPQYDGIVTVL